VLFLIDNNRIGLAKTSPIRAKGTPIPPNANTRSNSAVILIPPLAMVSPIKKGDRSPP